MFYQYLLTFLAFIGIIVGIVLVGFVVCAISLGLDKLRMRYGWIEKAYDVAKKVLAVIAYTFGGLLALLTIAGLFLSLHERLWG